MSIALRDYQNEAVKAVIDEYNTGTCRQLIILPTGSGKTLVMAAITKKLNRKTLILAHREELVQQAVDKFKLLWSGVDIGICMADKNEIQHQVVVGSVQSCSRPKRLDRLKEQGFDVLMIDECHHSTSDSYQIVINSLGFTEVSQKLLLGVTATGQRSDRHGLGDTFDKITYSRSIGTMIKAGYLSPIVGRKILTSFAMKNIHSQNGDFVLSDLAEIVNTPERNGFVAEKFKTYASGRKGVAFCVDVQHCHDLASAFKALGIPAESIWGAMDGGERKNALERLKAGKTQVAMSCGVLVEGFDEPSINVVVMARPTKSQGLYIQCVGRGLRLWPGKDDCLVLDFTDKHHNLDTVMSLTNTIPEAVIIREAEEIKQREEVDMRPKIEVLTECDEKFDVLGSRRFVWTSIGDGEWSLLDDERREIVLHPENGEYVAELYYPDGTSQQIVNDPIPMEYCQGVCEDYARRHLKVAFADTSSNWLNVKSQPTQAQCDYLQKQNSFRDGMSKVEAALEIRKIIALKNKQRRHMGNEPITDKQRYFLKSQGIDIHNMSKLQAIQEISKIKSKGLCKL